MGKYIISVPEELDSSYNYKKGNNKSEYIIHGMYFTFSKSHTYYVTAWARQMKSTRLLIISGMCVLTVNDLWIRNFILQHVDWYADFQRVGHLEQI